MRSSLRWWEVWGWCRPQWPEVLVDLVPRLLLSLLAQRTQALWRERQGRLAALTDLVLSAVPRVLDTLDLKVYYSPATAIRTLTWYFDIVPCDNHTFLIPDWTLRYSNSREPISDTVNSAESPVPLITPSPVHVASFFLAAGVAGNWTGDRDIGTRMCARHSRVASPWHLCPRRRWPTALTSTLSKSSLSRPAQLCPCSGGQKLNDKTEKN